MVDPDWEVYVAGQVYRLSIGKLYRVWFVVYAKPVAFCEVGGRLVYKQYLGSGIE